jgi:hypothetical protein
MKISRTQNLMLAGAMVFVMANCTQKLVDVNVTIVDQKTA